MSVTRNDVAKYAGVSKTTVSRVLNNKGYVSEESRKKVEEAIKALKYRPNLIARSLRTKQTKQILFHTTNLKNPFFVEVYLGMEDYARQHGYTIVISSHYDHDVVEQRQFDGIIFTRVPPEYENYNFNVPVVVTYANNYSPMVPFVSVDITDGAMKAFNHLFEYGHRKIGFLSPYTSPTDKRYLAYVDFHKKMGIPYNPERVVRGIKGSTLCEEGYNGALELIKRKPDITALFVHRDIIAIGAMAALAENGYDIPGDISVIGFDNIIQSRYTIPPLTTINSPKYEQGIEMARMLIKMINGENVQSITMKTELIIRKSTRKIL